MVDDRIKKRINVYWYYWTIPVLLFFAVINRYAGFVKVLDFDIEFMISVVSFLFGFLITVTFSMILSRVNSLKDVLAAETGRLASLFLLSKNLGNQFNKKIEERIDKYTVATLRDYTKYEVGREHVYGMYDDLSLVENKNESQNSIFQSFLYVLGELETVREKLEYLTNRRVEWSLKFADYTLGIVLIVLLFLNRGGMFADALFIVLSTVVFFIFLIIEDYDNLKIGDYTVNISNSEQLFDLIERDRYYPEELLGRVRLESGKSYRIGIFDSKLNAERIINLKYSDNFHFKLASLIAKFKRK